MNCKKHKEYVEDCADCIWGTDHQEISRKNQESEDLMAARFYFNLYHQLELNPEALANLVKSVRFTLEYCNDSGNWFPGIKEMREAFGKLESK